MMELQESPGKGYNLPKRLIIPTTTAACILIFSGLAYPAVDVLQGRAGRQGSEGRVGAKTPQTSSQRPSIAAAPCTRGPCAGLPLARRHPRRRSRRSHSVCAKTPQNSSQRSFKLRRGVDADPAPADTDFARATVTQPRAGKGGSKGA